MIKSTKIFIRRLLRRAYCIALPPPTLLCAERIAGLERLASIHHSAHLSVWPESPQSRSTLTFGDNVYIGKDVEIAAYGPGWITVGDDTSFQDRCQIYGNIEIGRHCIFARNALVISTEHQIRYRPSWLIRDQDRQFAIDNVNSPARAGFKIKIEDDCWVGWGSTVMPGVYVGRGAVIGANCVVTRDIAPFEIHGGVPNRRIGSRLEFIPPAALDPHNDEHLPYFYSGFRLSQAELVRSRGQGAIQTDGDAVIILQHCETGAVHLLGESCSDLIFYISVNGYADAVFTVDSGPFEMTLPVTRALDNVIPMPLRVHTHIQIRTRRRTEGPRGFRLNLAEIVGIGTAENTGKRI